MTLTEIAYYSRKAIKYGAIAFAALLVIAALWQPINTLRKAIFPPPSPKPKVEFGKLPAINLSSFQKTAKETFVLQTKTGQLPNLTTVVPVYFMPQLQTTLLDLDKAKQIAQDLGFENMPIEKTDILYRFRNPKTPAILDINIANKTFAISFNLNDSPELLQGQPAGTDTAINLVTSMLSKASLLTNDLKKGSITTDLLKIQRSSLVPAISLSESTFVRVNLFRQNLQNLAIIGPKNNVSNVWFIVAGKGIGYQDYQSQVIAGEYHYFPISDQNSTYPLKTVQEAVNELTSGNGFILYGPTSGQVIIRDIFLAYYDSGEPQQFLQPIFVFDSGEDQNFRAIVPAVSTKYYSQETQNQ